MPHDVNGHRLRRMWVDGIGYTYDAKTPTECQCCTSAKGCRCGKLLSDQAKELVRRERLAEQSKAEAANIQAAREALAGCNVDPSNYLG